MVVDSSDDGTAATIRSRWPDVDLIVLPTRTLPGRARNLAAERARTDLLAFLDADCAPVPGWLDALVDGLGPDDVGVAGAIGNGTPSSPVGTAGWLLEFSEWHPGRRGRPGHAASATLLVRRSDFMAAGGFREDLFPGEDTYLTRPWAAAGRLAFAPSARVDHANRTGVADYLRHQRLLGRCFAELCASSAFPHSRFGRRPWALAGGVLRVAALTLRLRGLPRDLATAAALSPLLLAGLFSWTTGVWSEAGRRRP